MREREGSIDWKAPRAPERDAGSTPAASTPSPDLIACADRYLQGRRTVLWGQFTIDREEDRAKAAAWLAEQVVGVLLERASARVTWADVGLVGKR